ncbi:hypothetical protein ITJ54_06625 [Curtobacterium sp. VKM Ac-2865]|uniref:hypothetical protein n=1 Tax=Curtobacterium sp. VKM Ac-2865 TaxID=2783817 RepID=UPI00188A3FB1|nr:hypothetical protein [Curtobacterium sp. VKM Ac-2865]MBF4582344.1 hypothetical protein [Curtobacterium sp. VKM Ac-2865]
MSARSLTVVGVVVIAFALLVRILNPTSHGASFVVLIVALVAGLACVVLETTRRSAG